MSTALTALVNIINTLHDFIVYSTSILGLNLTDKDLHFWFIGCIGMIIFIMCDAVFRFIIRWNISVISFIYTFTVLIVLVFGIEIEQKITHRGNMEFRDIVAGLWGFLAVFGVYLIAKITVYLARRLFKKYKDNKAQ